MKNLGIDIGSVYLGAAVLEHGEITETRYTRHGGNIMNTLAELLSDRRFSTYDTLGITGKIPGSGSNPFFHDTILCQAESGKILCPDTRNIFVIGGETFSLLFFQPDGKYIEHSINPPCASGTGTFIEQQAERLGITAPELSRLAAVYEGKVPSIATRCAVFAKTDIIHSMQEGYGKDAISAGLCRGIAVSIVDNLVKGRELHSPAAVFGGVSLNTKVLQELENMLQVKVIAPENSHIAGAVGAAALSSNAAKDGKTDPRDMGISDILSRETAEPEKKRPPLQTKKHKTSGQGFVYSENGDMESLLPKKMPEDTGQVFIGIDIGSTSTKAAVIAGDERQILGGFYTKTGGDPIGAVKKCVDTMMKALHLGQKQIAGVGTTGSGRKLIQKLFDADFVVNEITAHAKAASYLVPGVDTIIEIGGQDSKFTRLKEGEVYFSKMNYVCAAGTGSFIEEQAKRLEVTLDEFSELALGAEAPYTSDRCTVYMERDLYRLLSEGWSKDALAAAVLHSVRDNYMAKVVGRSSLGDSVVFQGATGRNRALVSAFEELIGKPVFVSPFCHLTGALGAALLCGDEESGTVSRFMTDTEAIKFSEEICDRCANRCLLTLAEKNGSTAGWGMKCGKEYDDRGPVKQGADIFTGRFREVMAPLEAGREIKHTPGPKETGKIAVPDLLYNSVYAPLWRHFLTRLGLNVFIPGKIKNALSTGKGIVNSDFCAPIIHAHGVFSELVSQGADLIFFPAIINENNPDQEEYRFKKKTTDAYFCYYSQYLPSIMSQLTSEDFESKIISPLIQFNSQSEDTIAEELYTSLAEHFPDLSPEDVGSAYRESRRLYTEAREKWSGYYAENADPDRLEIAMVGRPYIAMNSDLHLRIPEKLENLGASVFWQDEFDLNDVEPVYGAKYFERMHWQFGKQIIRLAEYAAARPNLFIVYITSFRCSPDSFILSYLQDIMEHYGKPFLILQVDEHSSSVGYETRIEAGINTFLNFMKKQSGTVRTAEETVTEARDDTLAPGDTVLIPYLDDCISPFWAACFQRAGYSTILLESREADLLTGYKYTNGGECMPLTALIGSAVERLIQSGLSPEKAFFYMPTIGLACNFPQFPILANHAFERAGLVNTKIGLINNMAPGEILPQSLAIKMLESNIIGSILYKLYYRIQPYETEKGSAAARFADGKERITAALLDGNDLKAELQEIVQGFRQIPRDETSGRKPRIGLLGDLYVKFNPLINQNIQETINRLGGELIIPSLTEYPFHFYDADIRLYGDNPRPFKLLRTIELRYEKLAEDIIGDELEPDFAECVDLMEKYNIKHYIAGETSINVGRALYFIKHKLVDAIVHVNPIFCCPGVVTSSIYRKIQEDFGVPIIDIFYDGTGKPNDVLIPHLHYLKEGLLSN